MLSTACKYAIRASLYLATHTSPTKKVGVESIANHLNVPKHYLGKLLQRLAKQKLVSSTKGPGGGFYLTQENLDTPLIKIVHLIDGNELFMGCVLGLESCSEANPCPLHQQYGSVRQDIRHTFENHTLAEIANMVSKNEMIRL